MKVCAKVEVVEIDGEVPIRDRPEIEITRHRIYGKERVNLKFPGHEKVYAVLAGELKAAIEVCTKEVGY